MTGCSSKIWGKKNRDLKDDQTVKTLKQKNYLKTLDFFFSSSWSENKLALRHQSSNLFTLTFFLSFGKVLNKKKKTDAAAEECHAQLQTSAVVKVHCTTVERLIFFHRMMYVDVQPPPQAPPTHMREGPAEEAGHGAVASAGTEEEVPEFCTRSPCAPVAV